MDITKEMMRQMKERKTFPITRSQQLALDYDLFEILARLDEIREMNLPDWYWEEYKDIYEMLCVKYSSFLDITDTTKVLYSARVLYKTRQKIGRKHFIKYKFIEKEKLRILNEVFEQFKNFDRRKSDQQSLFPFAKKIYERKQKSNSPYSYKLSLQDANELHCIIDTGEFDRDFQNINRNYTNWRNKLKKKP